MRQFSATESPLKIIKNAFFYLTLKALFFLKYLHFCLDVLFMQKNGLVRKIRLISNFMRSQTGKQIITIHILPDISRCRGNQTVKFDQLIKYNMSSIFIKKSCAKYGGETNLRPFSKNSKKSISLDH